MRARLMAKTGALEGKSFEIEDEAVIGRLPENHIPLDLDVVSGKHARIFFSPQERCYFLEDLGSRNGTFVGGVRVQEPERLGPLEIIDLADAVELIFQIPQLDKQRVEATAPGEKTRLEEGVLAIPPTLGRDEAPRAKTRLEASPMPLPPKFGHRDSEPAWATPHHQASPVSLPPAWSGPAAQEFHPPPEPDLARPEIEKTRMEHGTIPLPPRLGGLLDEEFHIPAAPPPASSPSDPPPPRAAPGAPSPPTSGRYALEVRLDDGTTSLIPLPEGVHLVGRAEGCGVVIEHPTLSREHARLTVEAHAVRVEDLGSTNQTLVEGQPISAETFLEAGVLVTFGGVEARLIRGDSAE